MHKSTKIILIGGLSVATIGLIAYFVLNKKYKQEEETIAELEEEDVVEDIDVVEQEDESECSPGEILIQPNCIAPPCDPICIGVV